MISVLLDTYICALFGHADFGVLVRHNCGAAILANSHCSGRCVARNTLEWENIVDMAATAIRVSKQAPQGGWRGLNRKGAERYALRPFELRSGHAF
jgi:hypothetical protein